MTIEIVLKLSCSYTTDLIRQAIEREKQIFRWIDDETQSKENRLVLWKEYEDLDFESIYKINREKRQEKEILINAFCIRKGLLRKANFAAFIQRYLAKRSECQLRFHYPETHILDLSHPDYLDEALNEAFELRDALANNEQNHSQPIPFILKASILDKASELFLFFTYHQLEEYFQRKYLDDESIGDLREWIVQRYIDNPKLIEFYSNRKFHLRVYVVAQGNLRVFVFDGILALFNGLTYEKVRFDQEQEDSCHITNTCAQKNCDQIDLVEEFFRLKGLTDEKKCQIFEQIKKIVAEIFSALHHEPTIFQPIVNAFEIFGFDFLLDENDQIFFLEANAFPDFKQTGDELSVLVRQLFENLVEQIIAPFFDVPTIESSIERRLHLVYDKQIGK